MHIMIRFQVLSTISYYPMDGVGRCVWGGGGVGVWGGVGVCVCGG